MIPLIIGGSTGIGLSIATRLFERGAKKIYIIGKDEINYKIIDERIRNEFYSKVVFVKHNLASLDLSIFDQFSDFDSLIITAGFGRVALFEDLTESEVKNLLEVNMVSIVRIIKHFYSKIANNKDFYTSIMVSICGQIVSPFFSVYGSAKGGLRFFIENINCELENGGFKNRILDVSPGSIDGTSFKGNETNLVKLSSLADEIIDKMFARELLFIPDYDSIYKNVIKRYEMNKRQFGHESYDYKISSKRISKNPQVVVGYLSGTFDLFHIGHLNLLRRAKEQCDYLIVSVHNSGAWKGKETFIPYNERRAIVESIKYVDEVVDDYVEDCDAWDAYHFQKLFVGSDYKGSERFNRYEEVLKNKAEIVYFEYTKGTSSTQLREAIRKK